MSKRVKISTNWKAFKQEKQLLIKQANQYTKAKEDFKTITESKDVEFNLEALNDYITKRTGFANVQSSASLMGYEAEYERLVEYFNSDIDTEQFEYDETFNRYTPTEDVLNTLEEQYSVYLDNTYNKDYDTLERIVKLLNKLDNAIFFDSIRRDYKQEWFVDMNRINFNQQLLNRHSK